MRLAASFAPRLELSSSELQSLMPGTIMNFSLLIRSGPREFLTGPMGPDMVGRCFLVRDRGLAEVENRDRERRRDSRPARMASMVEVRVWSMSGWLRVSVTSRA